MAPLQKYSDIKPQLDGLSKKEQYSLLLKTVEWGTFRNKVLSHYNGSCGTCGLKSGPILIELPFEEWKKQYDLIHKYNEEQNRLRKVNPNKMIEDLISGIPNAGLKPYPSRIIETGKTILQAHHKFYLWNRLPWEYKIDNLVALCFQCHTEVHQKETIYTYKDETFKIRSCQKDCEKCGGTGYLPGYDYWCDGICFDCNGIGFDPDQPYSWELAS